MNDEVEFVSPDPYGRRVLDAIDQLRRDLSGYHGQLKAHSDLAKHCDNQRKRIADLEGLYIKVKAERDETAMAFSKEHDRAEFLMRENEKLRKKLEFEREDNESIRALFDAVAPRCGRPDCPSLVEYVEKLRELVHKLWSVVYWYAPDLSELDEARDTVRDLGIEVDK